jgi:hypothetical protein
VDGSERRRLIGIYKQGAREVREAVAGISDAELDARSAPGEWTPREVVHHLPDSEMTSALRLRRLLVEDNPVLAGYDEEAFARTLHYGERPIEGALDLLEATRRVTAELLDRMSEDDWRREGTHTESGRYTCDDWLRIYATHAHDHADQIRRGRRAAAS